MSDKANGWQPIETAPKDGTRFLATQNLLTACICSWRDTSGISHPIFGATKTKEYWYQHGSHYFYEPTHWMPLQELPTE